MSVAGANRPSRSNRNQEAQLVKKYSIRQRYRCANVTGDDIDGDSKVDIVLASSSAKAVRVYFGVGDGTFDLPLALSTQHHAVVDTLADLDDDGDLDIVVGQYTTTGGIFNVLLNLRL